MIVRVQKRLCVRYPAPVARCVRRLRVLPPPERAGQTLLHESWTCEPEADGCRKFSDAFGNRVLELSHCRIASEFHFRLEMAVEAASHSAPCEMNLPPEGVGAFRLPSSLCDSGPRVVAAWQATGVKRVTSSRKASAAVTEDKAMAMVACLCHWTYRHLRYDPLYNGVSGASQVLASGAGMCAEFSHVMIALCRMSGLAARYVSGFNPAEGLMHAWVEVLCGEYWQAFDPTHGRAPSMGSIFVACGRDARDTAPHEGSYIGSPGARLTVKCLTTIQS